MNKKWIKFKLSAEVDWKKCEIDHVKPISSFSIFKGEEQEQAFNCKKCQPILKQNHLQKITEIIFLEIILQFVKAYQLLKQLTKKDNVKTSLDEVYSKPLRSKFFKE